MKECVLCKTRYQKGSGVTFHKFPTDIRLELWLKNINQPSWRPKKYDCICSKHFSDDCFIKHNSCTTLKKCSTPTIFCSSAENVSSTHESMDLPTPSVSETRMVTPAHPVPTTITVDVKRTLIMDQNNTNLSGRKRRSTSCDPQQSTPPKKVRSLSEICDSIKHDHHYENSPKSSKKSLQRIKNSLIKSRARVKALSQNVKRLKVSVANLRTIIRELKKKKLIGDDCADMLYQYDDFKPQLLRRMSANTGGSVNRSKYPPELRSFAITLNFYSPKAYNFVRKKFKLALPHPSVIRSWYSSVDANPGFSVECFNALKLKSDRAKQKGEKLICALIMDEIHSTVLCTTIPTSHAIQSATRKQGGDDTAVFECNTALCVLR